ncbi:hypothetical protein GCM10011611_17050 [Aliidongia dinghuensis]|uniref:Uncharacterized protein n=1 Tax=Aliidongia dinghuensis TaxID=1867774 RepID=A0A8J2YRL9_9PROT|nr:hypothetical protein GCM10011611_17050 [Aliidongia dinghuensis]
MSDMLDRFPVNAMNVVLVPNFPELWTELAELVDKRRYFRPGSRARGVRSKRAYKTATDTFPVVLRRAGTRIEEKDAQDVALILRTGRIIAQHNSRRSIPGDHVPDRRQDQRRARMQSIKHML